MTEHREQSDYDRVSYRSHIARSLSKSVEGNVQVLSREQITTFGIAEWRLIERLEESDGGEVTVGLSDDYSAAQRLAECSMVDVEEIDDETYRIIRKFAHVVVPVFES